MVSIWIVLLWCMADVMGHGGDGAGQDPPPPYYTYGSGGHYEEAPKKKTRGKAKNLKLSKMLAKQGGPLDIPFDTQVTYTPVGEVNDVFTREIGIYMWRSVALDRKGWKDVTSAEKNALHEHISANFDLEAVERDRERAQKKGGINHVIQKRYTDRKHDAKAHFLANGGYEDLERARASTPEDMTDENWRRAVNHFLTDEHRRRSAINKEVRQKQKYTNRGGTSTYSSTCYKKDQSQLQTFFDAHTDKHGVFDSALAEKQYYELQQEFQTQTQGTPEGSSSGVSKIRGVFEKVMGSRRGHLRGLGPKPPSSEPSTFFDSHQHQQTPTDPFTPEAIAGLLNNPTFMEGISQYLSSKKPSYQDDEEETDDGDE